MSLFGRLDRFGMGDRFRKPRHGVCGLCRRPVIDHPLWAHRFAALRRLI
jgi:hypothetical protein